MRYLLLLLGAVCLSAQTMTIQVSTAGGGGEQPLLTYTSPATTTVWNNVRPTLPARGSTVLDPNSSNRILRVTQSGDLGEGATVSFAPFDAGWRRAWNSNSTKMMFYGSGGMVHWKEFVPTTMSLGPGQGTPPASIAGNITFDDTDPDLAWGIRNGRYLVSYKFSTDQLTDVRDLEAVPGYDTGLYCWIVYIHNRYAAIATAADGQGQNTGWQVLVIHLDNPSWYRVIDFKLNRIYQNGSPSYVAFDNAVPTTGVLHEIIFSRDGEVVMCDLHNTWAQLPWNVFVNLSTNHVERSTTNHDESGNTHAAFGFNGAYINSSANVSTSCGYQPDNDGRGWSYRRAGYNNQDATWKDLWGCATDGPTWSIGHHLTWMNNQSGAYANQFPVIGVSARGSATKYYLDDEIYAVSTTAAQFGATIWRFARHYNEPKTQNCADIEWKTAQVSPDGKWVLYYSSWYGDTGTGTCTNSRRMDMFVFELK